MISETENIIIENGLNYMNITNNITNIILKRCKTDIKSRTLELAIELLLDEILDTIMSYPTNSCSLSNWTSLIKMTMDKMIKNLGEGSEKLIYLIISKKKNKIISEFNEETKEWSVKNSFSSHREKYDILEEMSSFLKK